jgi:hypothetical protein
LPIVFLARGRTGASAVRGGKSWQRIEILANFDASVARQFDGVISQAKPQTDEYRCDADHIRRSSYQSQFAKTYAHAETHIYL